jgi:hypothetical protein
MIYNIDRIINIAEVTNRLNALNQTITNKYNMKKFDEFYNSVSDEAKKVLDSNEYSRLMVILKMDPKKAFEALAESEDFLKLLEKSPKFRNTFVSFLANTAMFIETNPTSKAAIEAFTKAGGFLKKVDSWISPALKKDLLSYASKLKGSLSKLGKALPGPWAMMGIDIGLKSARNFFSDQSETKGKIGQSISDASVDAIFSVGPIDGLLLGATTGNPYFALGGCLIGSANQIVKFFCPKLHKTAKKVVKDAVGVVGKAVDEGINKVGKGIKGAWNGVKNFFKTPKQKITTSNGWFA